MIGFAAPWALLGLAAAAIPFLLHLFARREPPTVVFPATRYLAETARAHHRRLTLQHWLLLVVRTLLIAALAFAAAGPTVPSGGVASHAPAAIAVLLDNSLSSGAVAGGTPVLDELRQAARDILEAARPDDAVWLVTADGIPRRGSAAQLLEMVDRLTPAAGRLELGAAVTGARDVLTGQVLPGMVVVLSDLQATALSAPAASQGSRPPGLVVVRPEHPPVSNLAVSAIDPGRQPWGPEGGRLAISIAGDEKRSAALSVRFGSRPPRRQLVRGGSTVSVASGALPPGWWPVQAELEADELRADDTRLGAVRVIPPARASCRAEDRFLTVACDVLFAGGRFVRGNDVAVGWLGPGASIVQPPSDRAAIGALNRALAARGVPWSYGELVPGEAPTDSGPIMGRQLLRQRYTLRGPSRAEPDVLVSVSGSPWLVRSGNVLLLGSRLDPDWTDLPVSAEFVPFLDFLANRAVRGELAMLEASPGELVTLPVRATALEREGVSRSTGQGEVFRPIDPGLYFILSGRDTIGVLAVNPDPRESLLARPGDGELRELWPGARLVGPGSAREATWTAGGRADLRGWMLGLAALLALADASLAGWGGRGRKPGTGS